MAKTLICAFNLLIQIHSELLLMMMFRSVLVWVVGDGVRAPMKKWWQRMMPSVLYENSCGFSSNYNLPPASPNLLAVRITVRRQAEQMERFLAPKSDLKRKEKKKGGPGNVKPCVPLMADQIHRVQGQAPRGEASPLPERLQGWPLRSGECKAISDFPMFLLFVVKTPQQNWYICSWKCMRVHVKICQYRQ